MNIGFIGLGSLGVRIAGRLLDAGYELGVFDIRKEAAAPLLARGAAWRDSARAMAESCELVLSALPAPRRLKK